MANELIVMPDPVIAIRAAVLARLAEVDADYADVPVVGRVPDPRPDMFVRIVRTGGVITDKVVSRAMATIECWAGQPGGSPAESAQLAEAVRAVVNAMEGEAFNGTPVYRVTEFSGPANSPDPASATPRHTWTVEVALRGSAV